MTDPKKAREMAVVDEEFDTDREFQFHAQPAGVWSDLCECNNANVDPQSRRCEDCVHFPTDGEDE